MRWPIAQQPTLHFSSVEYVAGNLKNKNREYSSIWNSRQTSCSIRLDRDIAIKFHTVQWVHWLQSVISHGYMARIECCLVWILLGHEGISLCIWYDFGPPDWILHHNGKQSGEDTISRLPSFGTSRENCCKRRIHNNPESRGTQFLMVAPMLLTSWEYFAWQKCCNVCHNNHSCLLHNFRGGSIQCGG